MPGCVSQGRSRQEALSNVRKAMEGWSEIEAEQGRQPLEETPELVLDAVREALQIIGDMRQAGELTSDGGFELELATVELRHSLAA